MPLKNRSTKKISYLLFLLLTTFGVIFLGGNSFKAHALPAYCNYDSTTHQCCKTPGSPGGGPQILNCTFPEVGSDLFCGTHGTIVIWGIACPY